MPFNGSGTFTVSGAPFAANTTIAAGAMNPKLTDFAGGLSNVVTRDGQSPPTANIPMGGFRHTGLSDGVANSDSAAFGQIGMRFIETKTPTGTPIYLEFALPSGFNSFVFDVANVAPSANGQLAFQLSLDGGGTWLTGASDYSSGATYNLAPGYVVNAATSTALLSVTVSSAHAVRARVDLSPTIASSTGTYYTSTGAAVESSSTTYALFTYGGAAVQTVTRPSRIRFFFNGTTFRNFGSITLLGVRP